MINLHWEQRAMQEKLYTRNEEAIAKNGVYPHLYNKK